MKICFCNTIGTWGGGEKWHYEMATALSQLRYEVHFIVSKSGQIDRKLDKKIKKKCLSIGKFSFLNPFKYYNLVSYFRNNAFDAVLINSPSELKLVARAAKAAKINKVIYRRGSDVVVKNKMLNKYLLEKVVDIIIANSQATKASLLKSGINIAGKIVTINNGIQPPSKEYAKVVNKIPVIAAVGRLSKQKGFDLLIQVAAKLKERGKAFIIRIAGEGELRTELEELIKTFGVADCVQLIGFSDDVFNFINQCDVFALSSRYEGFGYVTVEAMYMKKPVIAFDTSSTSEIVKQDETGFLIPCYDIDLFADKLFRLLNNKDTLQMFGNAGYIRAMNMFNFKKTIDKIKELIFQ